MTTDLFTVNEHELIDLVATVMAWKHIRHVPVEDGQHRLVGFVTNRALLRVLGESLSAGAAGEVSSIPVGRVMQRDVITVTPETPALTAIELMKAHKISGMPVIDSDRRLVGIITERDFMQLSGQLLEQFLAGDREEEGSLTVVADRPARTVPPRQRAPKGLSGKAARSESAPAAR
jgi:CBS domain-containing protein